MLSVSVISQLHLIMTQRTVACVLVVLECMLFFSARSNAEKVLVSQVPRAL